MLLHELGAVIVARSHIFSPGFRAVVKNVAHLSHGENGDTDAEFIHLLQSLFGRPWTSTADASERRRLMVMVHIDGAATNIQPVDLALGEAGPAAQYG